MKNGSSSEIKAIRKYLPDFEVEVFGQKEFLSKDNLKKKDFDLAEQGFNFAQKAIQSRRYDLIILDEINIVVSLGLLKVEDLLALIKKTPQKIELILTGRQAPKKIIQTADLVTEMKEVKHYYKKGVKARQGIEY